MIIHNHDDLSIMGYMLAERVEREVKMNKLARIAVEQDHEIELLKILLNWKDKPFEEEG